MSKDYRVIAIANWFIKKALCTAQDIEQLKLMKLVYIAQGLSLARDGVPLYGEPIEAWKYGPVVRSLWEQTQKYGRKPISSELYDEIFDEKPQVPEKDKSTVNLLELVWEAFSKYSGVQLSNWTHEEDSPWATSMKEKDNCLNHIISNELIKNYFNRLMNSD